MPIHRSSQWFTHNAKGTFYMFSESYNITIISLLQPLLESWKSLLPGRIWRIWRHHWAKIMHKVKQSKMPWTIDFGFVSVVMSMCSTPPSLKPRNWKESVIFYMTSSFPFRVSALVMKKDYSVRTTFSTYTLNFIRDEKPRMGIRSKILMKKSYEKISIEDF